VEYGFSRTKTLATNSFANLTVCPTLKTENFSTASAEKIGGFATPVVLRLKRQGRNV